MAFNSGGRADRVGGEARTSVRRPLKSAGKQELWIGLTKAPRLRDRSIQPGRQEDRRSRSISTIPPWSGKKLSLGVYNVAAGEHAIEVQIVGSNPKAGGDRHMFGTDFLEWRPVK